MKKSWLSLAIAFLLIASLLAGCGGTQTPAGSTPPANTGSPSPVLPDDGPESESPAGPANPDKETIVFGGARPQSGVYTVFEETVYGSIYRLWVEQVNAKGGIYVEEYGKKMPIELKIYDDASDIGTMTRMLEKLAVEDKVDFMLPPCSTAAVFAAVPIADKYGYLLVGAEGGSATLAEQAAKYPNFFSTANHSSTQIPALVDMLSEQGVKSAYIVFIEDLHGTEYSGAAVPALASAGIEVKGVKSIPPDIQDMSPILNDAKATGAEAYLMFAYPDQNYLAVGQAIGMGYNPNVFLLGPGGCFDVFQHIFGTETVEGVMSFGAWNSKVTPGAQEFLDMYWGKYEGDPTITVDWWGHLPYYAGLEVLEQAIERAGTLDNAKVAEVIRTEKFDTVLGEVWFENGAFAPECFTGNVGQWQSGVFEVLDVGSRRTADPIIPKPAWPAP